MGFEWDPEKDAVNQAKHLLSFRQAAQIFRGFHLVREDNRRDYGERRFIALGVYDNEVLQVVYALRENNIRIISAWKAGKHGRQAYKQAHQV